MTGTVRTANSSHGAVWLTSTSGRSMGTGTGVTPTNVFAKGLYVLEALVEADGPLSLSGLVERTGLPKTTVHRLVSVLVDRGWAKATGRGYGLGYLPLRAAAAFETSLDIRLEAEPFLVQLRNDLDETVHLATLDHEFRVVYLEKLVPRFQAVGLMRSRVGFTAPAYCTGVGKAMLACLPDQELARFFGQVPLTPYTHRTLTTPAELLADLDRVRTCGYALCEEEHEEGVSCVAAAIRGRHGEPVAAISLSGPTARMARHLAADSSSPAAVRDAADAVSRMIGGVGQLGSHSAQPEGGPARTKPVSLGTGAKRQAPAGSQWAPAASRPARRETMQARIEATPHERASVATDGDHPGTD